eukprot:252881-Amorphochlora_amoeboformis.AAC.1
MNRLHTPKPYENRNPQDFIVEEIDREGKVLTLNRTLTLTLTVTLAQASIPTPTLVQTLVLTLIP